MTRNDDSSARGNSKNLRASQTGDVQQQSAGGHNISVTGAVAGDISIQPAPGGDNRRLAWLATAGVVGISLIAVVFVANNPLSQNQPDQIKSTIPHSQISTSDTEPSNSPAPRRVNLQYLADLVRKGPFTENPPSPLTRASLKFRDVSVSDESAIPKIAAVGLEVSAGSISADEQLAQLTIIEIYPSADLAKTRAEARLSQLLADFPEGGKESNVASSFCFLTDMAPDENGPWICGGYNEYAFIESTVSPAPNAYLHIATEMLTAAFRYVDRLAKQATEG
ncbi:MAG: hypothetical protein HKP61_01285 [Dactylosporangium sp.]|nr:hypothetical protein [Dactylosporangium sp.]NNJ59603.1 hypothetical protein [Dactylosporangium sp.]